jgi:2-dehydro-3-deoxyphosphooctonate aldolase (KDO 8-P synthase)
MNKSTTKDAPILMVGPCSMESEKLVLAIAEAVFDLQERHNFSIIFKASFDKANRTSGSSFRSVGLSKGIEIFGKVKSEFNLSLITDVHEQWQVKELVGSVDVLQVPAFLCRQTDLLNACGESGLGVNIKKGQFMSPEDMKYAVEKVRDSQPSSSIQPIYLTERGSSFGYNNLVVDMRSLPIMREFAPVIFDVTHSTQRPGALTGSSGGDRKWAPLLARAAAAVGVDGYFIETHPDPDSALSDGPLMIPLKDLDLLLTQITEIEKSLTSDSRRGQSILH